MPLFFESQIRMLHIVLYQPEIPPNTGNIIRLCANTQTYLHLIKPLGFSVSDKQMRRAGLDYHQLAHMQIHDDFTAFLDAVQPERCYALTTKGSLSYTQPTFKRGDCFIFGPETRGLPTDMLEHSAITEKLRIPQAASSRSLNLSNSVAIVVYEALRQFDFCFE